MDQEDDGKVILIEFSFWIKLSNLEYSFKTKLVLNFWDGPTPFALTIAMFENKLKNTNRAIDTKLI
ncbi:unnamed protein product [marine sediment metagenome]|uniref:Uncharacterized protein n=1 Tax=marine sediment metagenome TaxID=412755 RepID=X1B194_9ZZZZ